MPEIDLSKRSPGSFAPELLSGAPVDFFLDLMYRRVGVPLDDPLRSTLVNTHPSDMTQCPRLPDVFPPEDWEKRTKSGKLQSVQDWLDLVASADTTPRERVPENVGGVRGFPVAAAPEPEQALPPVVEQQVEPPPAAKAEDAAPETPIVVEQPEAKAEGEPPQAEQQGTEQTP